MHHIVTVNPMYAEIGYLFFTLPTRILLLSRVKMVDYEVTVSTGNLLGARTFNSVFIKLVGENGESERTCLMDHNLSFGGGAVSLTFSKCFFNFAYRPI